MSGIIETMDNGVDMENLELDSVQVLSHIIKKMIDYGYLINYTKVQKVLYCCYGVVLATYNKRLCKEHPKAWSFGPAFPRAYNAHKKNKYNLSDDPISSDGFPEDIRTDIDDTIKYFGKFKASSLVNWSHQVNSPWFISTNNGKELYTNINDDLIKFYFRDQVIANEV